MESTLPNILALSDNQLMGLFANEDDQIAFERLYHKYKTPLIRFSYGYTGNMAKAEEIVHETFLKVYRFKKQYDQKKNFRTWLWTICKNTNLDALDKDKHQKNKEESIDHLNLELVDVDDSVLEKLITNSNRNQLEKIIETLPLSQREALLLWMNDDLTYDEMGLILNKSPQAIKNLVHRAKFALKEQLEGV